MKKGILYAAAAYGIWGILPVLLKTLANVPAFQITAHRAVWCFLFLIILVIAQGQLTALKATLTRRNLLIYTLTAGLLSVNWLVFVWAVNNGFIVDSSLGYFINPLVSVLLGVIFIFKNDKGEEVARVALPPGGSVEVRGEAAAGNGQRAARPR